MQYFRSTIVFAAAILVGCGTYAQKHVTGLVFDDNAYQLTERISPALRFTDKDLPAFSLKKYCPIPGDQGQLGSCVGWATGYGALTISAAISDSIIGKDKVTGFAMSPMYIYNQIKLNGCKPGGSKFTDALLLLKNKGDCKKADFDPSNCDIAPTENDDLKARGFKIKDFYNIFGTNDNPDAKIAATVKSINARKPVVAGISLTATFETVGVTGEWQPQPTEPVVGGHAVCIIGYDNVLQHFEVLNSYGVNWGNQGFFTISYSDFGKFCKYGYQMVLEKNIDKGGNYGQTMSGVFDFKKFKGYNADNDTYEFGSISPVLNGNYYTLPEGSVKKDDFYRIVASGMQKDNYVYIFSIKPDNTAEIIFPLGLSAAGAGVNDIAVVPANNMTIEIPVDDKKGLSTDLTGTDYLCILYSREKIEDIQSVVAAVNGGNGEFATRLQAALGNRLIPFNKITYTSNTMGFKAASGSGTVAPIILKVNVVP